MIRCARILVLLIFGTSLAAAQEQPIFVEEPPPELLKRFKADVKYIAGVRLVALNEGSARMTSTSWVPLRVQPDDRDRVLLFSSATTSAGWYRTGYHWLGEPREDMQRDGFRFHELSTSRPDGDAPALDQFTTRGEVLKHMAIYSEATCFLGVTKIDDEQFELSLDYLGLEFPEPFKSRGGKEVALYGVITVKPIRRRIRPGEEISIKLVDDKGRKASKTAYLRIFQREQD